MLNLMYMVQHIIEDLFTNQVGKWQGEYGTDGKPTERKALLAVFKVKKILVQMLIHAPANYVGVYIRQKGKEWVCAGYHDSCWREPVNRLLWNHREDISFSSWPQDAKDFDIITTLTSGIHVVKLDEIQLDALKQIRKKKYG